MAPHVEDTRHRLGRRIRGCLASGTAGNGDVRLGTRSRRRNDGARGQAGGTPVHLVRVSLQLVHEHRRSAVGIVCRGGRLHSRLCHSPDTHGSIGRGGGEYLRRGVPRHTNNLILVTATHAVRADARARAGVHPQACRLIFTRGCDQFVVPRAECHVEHSTCADRSWGCVEGRRSDRSGWAPWRANRGREKSRRS